MPTMPIFRVVGRAGRGCSCWRRRLSIAAAAPRPTAPRLLPRRLAAALLATTLAAGAQARAERREPPRVSLEPGPGLRVSADELSYRPGRCAQGGVVIKESCLELRGQVRVEVGSLKLRAARLTVALDPRGRPRRLEAQGGVELRAGDAHGRASRAVYQIGEAALELTGAARIQIAALKLELEGERVELDLASGGLRVRAARARLQTGVGLPAGGGGHALR